MPAQLLDGKILAARVRAEAARGAAALAAAGRPPMLVSLLVGESPAGEVYLASQAASCREAGIGYRLDRLPADLGQEALHARLRELGADPAVTGILLQQPLPAGLDARAAREALDPRKDVEGVHPANLGGGGGSGPFPCTALAALACVEASGVALRGAEAVVVGHSDIVGKPTALLLLDRLATVTVCHVGTVDLAAHTRRAGVLVVAAGKPGLVGAGMVRPGAVVVDVGINRVRGPAGRMRTVGDCDFEAVRETAGWITPVPGGVGPVTVAMLLRNTVAAARRLAGG